MARMRFSYAETFCDPSFLSPLAVAAEDAGYDSFIVPDSVQFPAASDTLYPYTADGDRAFLEDKPIIEPFTLIPYLAAQTTTLRFTTFVLKLAIRPPVLVAKQAASIAVLSNDRLRLGVGISPWPEDFAAMGLPWEKRGVRMDETVDIVRGLMAGGWFEYDGEVWKLDRCKITPVPAQPVPILVGGHSAPALRRAARRGDGWIHAGGGDGSDLAEMIAKVHALRADYGRAGEPFEIHVISMDAYSADGVRRLEDAGVTDVIVGFRWPYTVEPDTQPLTEKIDALRAFADRSMK
jgi:probable F420-dependent oxidoreductase